MTLTAVFRCPHCGWPYGKAPATAVITHPCAKHPKRTIRNPRPQTTLVKETAE